MKDFSDQVRQILSQSTGTVSKETMLGGLVEIARELMTEMDTGKRKKKKAPKK